MTRDYLIKGVKVMGLGQWRKKNKNCCMMFILTANQSCGFPETPKNCLKVMSVLKMVLFTKRSILGSERSNGSRKLHVRDVEGPYGHPPQNFPKSIFPIDFFMLFQIKHIARSKSQVTWSWQPMSRWPPWKNAEKWKIRISVTQWLIITDKHNLTINICFCGWKMQ